MKFLKIIQIPFGVKKIVCKEIKKIKNIIRSKQAKYRRKKRLTKNGSLGFIDDPYLEKLYYNSKHSDRHTHKYLYDNIKFH